jgi:Leucine-rich repeat (LRR) protein
LTSLDISDNRLGGIFNGYNDNGSGYGSFTATPAGPKAIADAIRDMGALLILNLSSNSIGGSRMSMNAVAEMLRQNSVLQELDISNNNINGTDAGIIAGGLGNNRALTKLYISRNGIPSEQEGELQRICVAGGVELTI